MTLTADEQRLYEFAHNALPGWIKDEDEFLAAAAKLFGQVDDQVSYLFRQALITTAEGATSTTPDWLNQHARDRGSGRRAGEGDAALAERLRVIPDALTRQALIDAANDILSAAGVAGQAALLELPRDAAWLGDYTAPSGTGGAFVQLGSVSKFTPTELPWPVPPFTVSSVVPSQSWQLTIAGAANAGNNGTRAIIGLEGDKALVVNGSGVAGADPGVTWTAKRLDVTGNVTDGFARTFCDRGYRTWSGGGRPFGLIVILPFGTSAGTASSVLESIRGKKAAGFKVLVERRINP